jgi:hypothetical protein
MGVTDVGGIEVLLGNRRLLLGEEIERTVVGVFLCKSQQREAGEKITPPYWSKFPMTWIYFFKIGVFFDESMSTDTSF